MDRRTWVRYACELNGDCQPMIPLEAGNRWPAQVMDISGGGVAVLLSRRFEPGTLLTLVLGSEDNVTACLPVARVCRVHREGAYWLLGCSFAIELPAEDLRQLLRPSAVSAGLFRKVRKTLRKLDETMPPRKQRSLRSTSKVEPAAPLEAQPTPCLKNWLFRCLPLSWRLHTT
jgi:hypothetical protein